MSVIHMIEDLGDTAKVAAHFGVAGNVVSMWKIRGKIPVHRWASFIRLARIRKVKYITLQRLAEMHIMEDA